MAGEEVTHATMGLRDCASDVRHATIGFGTFTEPAFAGNLVHIRIFSVLVEVALAVIEGRLEFITFGRIKQVSQFVSFPVLWLQFTSHFSVGWEIKSNLMYCQEVFSIFFVC